MKVVVDAIPVQVGSASIVVEHLLQGWAQLDVDDELHLVTTPDLELDLPAEVVVHRVRPRPVASRLWSQTVDLPRLCRRLGADVLLAGVPATTLAPLPCPRVVLAYDVRHELRPEQFSARTRLLRRLSWNPSFRRARGIVTISERTRGDLLRSRPWLADRPVRAAPLGADHADGWVASAAAAAEREPAAPYAVAFGHFGNKNVDLVLAGWAQLHAAGEAIDLVLLGLAASARAEVAERVEQLGLADVVRLSPWLADDEFQATFAGAHLVVFPSDFEGYGLPAAEAMRLGIRLVVSPEPALLEVTGGNAEVMRGWTAGDLSEAVRAALARTDAQVAEARAHVADLTWRRTAELARGVLLEAISGAGGGSARMTGP